MPPTAPLSHSPGPWTIFVRREKNQYADASIRTPPTPNHPGGQNIGLVYNHGDNCRGDALLISKAPALLETIEHAIDVLGDLLGNDHAHMPKFTLRSLLSTLEDAAEAAKGISHP